MDSSAEVPKMHQNSWRPGLRPRPHYGSSQRHRKPPRNPQEPGGPGSAFGASSFGPRFAPAMLISLRRHRLGSIPTVYLDAENTRQAAAADL